MSRPRQILPGRFYLLTRRCTQRQFLLRPDATTNQAFTYCLAEASQRFDIEILVTVAESNHHHTVLYDRHGRIPQFMEHFHKMVARCMNARWGRWENMWAAGQPGLTELLTKDAVIDTLVYAASNPVKDLLVERATQWPGVNGYSALLSGRVLCAKRPHFFFRAGGMMPEAVQLRLVIPPELGPADEIIAAVRAGVEKVERETRELRARHGKRIVGRRAIRQQSHQMSPSSKEPRRKLRPRFAGPLHAILDAAARFHAFLAAYKDARKRWLMRETQVTFPSGTYWLARFAPVDAVKDGS